MAKDMATGKEQNIRITASTGLNEEEIKNMVRDAELHAEDDRKRKQEIETKNQLDNLIYSTEKTLNENRDKLPGDDAKTLEDALSSGKDALKSGDADRMKRAIDDLTKASHKLAETLYKKTAETGPKGPDGQSAGEHGAQQGGRKGDDDVVDAEFEDVKK
jgi:molecular chaperone DnaK